jgi:hypothetical protein
MSIDVDQLRTRLRGFRSRGAAIGQAMAGGDEAVDAAVELLNDRNDGVRWSAIRILSEIGDARAIDPLVSLLERARNTTDVANALRVITGKDLGDDAIQWRAWQAGHGSEAHAGDLSNSELTAAVTLDLPVTLTPEGGHYVAKMALDDGRSQTIWVDFSAADQDGEPILQLSTACGPASSNYYEWALELNMTIPFGAIGIAKLGDENCFALVDSYSRSTVDPQDIAKSLTTLARRGDAIENSLSEEDRH